MNAPYAPPPGQPYPPGYPPPPRQGMGCFAKGCLATVLVFLVLGILAGIGGWFLYNTVRPFVSTAPVAVRTFPATPAQYSALLARIQAFQTELENGRGATLALSGDDLNVFIARSSSYESARGKLYLSIIDNQLVIDTSVALSGATRRSRSNGTTYYFNGKLYCDVSFADGEFDITVRKMETLDGEPASALLKAIVDNPEFSHSLSRSFNNGFRNSLHKNPDGEAFVAKIRRITIENNHVVLTAGDA